MRLMIDMMAELKSQKSDQITETTADRSADRENISENNNIASEIGELETRTDQQRENSEQPSSSSAKQREEMSSVGVKSSINPSCGIRSPFGDAFNLAPIQNMLAQTMQHSPQTSEGIDAETMNAMIQSLMDGTMAEFFKDMMIAEARKAIEPDLVGHGRDTMSQLLGDAGVDGFCSSMADQVLECMVEMVEIESNKEGNQINPFQKAMFQSLMQSVRASIHRDERLRVGASDNQFPDENHAPNMGLELQNFMKKELRVCIDTATGFVNQEPSSAASCSSDSGATVQATPEVKAMSRNIANLMIPPNSQTQSSDVTGFMLDHELD